MEQKDFESKKLKTKNSEINVEKACKVVEQRSFKTCWMSKNKVVNLWMDLIVCSETFMLTLHKNFAALMFLPSTICNFEKSNFHCINATFIKNMQWGSFDPRSTHMSQTSKTNKVFIPPINHSWTSRCSLSKASEPRWLPPLLRFLPLYSSYFSFFLSLFDFRVRLTVCALRLCNKYKTLPWFLRLLSKQSTTVHHFWERGPLEIPQPQVLPNAKP